MRLRPGRRLSALVAAVSARTDKLTDVTSHADTAREAHRSLQRSTTCCVGLLETSTGVNWAWSGWQP